MPGKFANSISLKQLLLLKPTTTVKNLTLNLILNLRSPHSAREGLSV